MENKNTPEWKPVNPAADVDCSVNGLPEQTLCYPKAVNPLLEYRKQRNQNLCNPSPKDPCILSSEGMVLPNAKLKYTEEEVEYEDIKNDTQYVSCDDVFGYTKIWNPGVTYYLRTTEFEDDGTPVYIIKEIDKKDIKDALWVKEDENYTGETKEYAEILVRVLDDATEVLGEWNDALVAAGSYVESVNSAAEDSYKLEVRNRLNQLAYQQALAMLSCRLVNNKLSLTCPTFNDREPRDYEGKTEEIIDDISTPIDFSKTLTQGEVEESAVPENKEDNLTLDYYRRNVDLANLKNIVLNNAYNNLIVQLDCYYGNAVYTARCQYNTYTDNDDKTWVKDLTINEENKRTVIDYNELTADTITVTNSETGEVVTYNKKPYVITYTTSNAEYLEGSSDTIITGYNWTEDVNSLSIIPCYEIYNVEGTKVNRYLYKITLNNLSEKDYKSIAWKTIYNNFNTVKGYDANYVDPYTIHYNKELQQIGQSDKDDQQSEEVDEFEVEDEITIPSKAEANNRIRELVYNTVTDVDNTARTFAKEQLLCVYTNNKLTIHCPPGKKTLSGEESSTIEAGLYFEDNLYKANNLAFEFLKTQLGECNSGNVRVMAFCDRQGALTAVSGIDDDPSAYNLLSKEEWDNGSVLIDHTKPIYIYLNDFVGDNEEFVLKDIDITDVDCGKYITQITSIGNYKSTSTYNDKTGKPTPNGTALDDQSISYYVVEENQFVSTDKTVKQNNDLAIETALSAISCMYSNSYIAPIECILDTTNSILKETETTNDDGSITYKYECTTSSVSIDKRYRAGIDIGPTACGDSVTGRCAIGDKSDAIEENTIIANTPLEANQIAVSIALASRLCIPADKVGTPGSQIADIEIKPLTCSGCSVTCCLML